MRRCVSYYIDHINAGKSRHENCQYLNQVTDAEARLTRGGVDDTPEIRANMP